MPDEVAKAEPSRATNQQLTVQNMQQVVEFQDPRELPLEERLQQAQEHEAKLKHIADTVPIKIKHLQGSSAGAGSGEFHIYRNARNQEQKRVREMEEKWKKEQEILLQKRSFEESQAALDAKTAKRRAKRQKRKDRKGTKDTQSQSAEVERRQSNTQANVETYNVELD